MTHGPPAADAHPKKVRGRPGNPLLAAGLSASTYHWGANGHHQGKHRP